MNALHSLFQGLLFAHGHIATPTALREFGLSQTTAPPSSELPANRPAAVAGYAGPLQTC